MRYFTYPEGPSNVNKSSLSSDMANVGDRRKKINSTLLFNEDTQYESDASKNNDFNNILDKKNSRRNVLKMIFSPVATAARMKSIDR